MAAPDWHWDAACKDMPVALFYAHDAPTVAAVRQVCRECPVRQSCLDDAMRRGDQYGLWGGLTVKQRNGLKRSRLWTGAI